MFKKLKLKISEEQSPGQQQQGLPRATPPVGNRSRTSSLTEPQDDTTATPDKENVSRSTINRSSDNINGNDATSIQKSDSLSFTQKLQLRVPSMESIFRSPVKESLFRSPSKESLVRFGSRESLNRIDSDNPGPAFDPPSDIESEAEETVGSLEGLSKEQVFHRLHRMERSLGNYRGKYSELVTAYRTVQRDKDKLQSILSQSQDKALRRIGELREELQMDQQAKKHLQEEFDATLEEKDQLISVLNTQVTLLKQRVGKGEAGSEVPEPVVSSDPDFQSSMQEVDTENISTPDGSGDTAKTLEALHVRVKRQENILQRCKALIRSQKEQSAQLSSEKEALQEQLQERLQELEKIKELHTSEKTKLITQLRDAKNLIEQLEQDKGMVIAETKRQMHETLEMKEEEVSQLRSRVKQLTTQCEELKEQKEKSEKSTFEELEKAFGASQKTEEARKQGKVQMDEQIKAIEQAGEEERLSLQKELSRVKQEVVDIMKKSCDSRIDELEKLHAEALLTKGQKLKERLNIQEQEFGEQMKAALANCRAEYSRIIQEKEQQGSLALEELELQKKAMQSQTTNQLQEMQQDVEAYRTRILELESSLAKSSQDTESKREELTTRVESETNKHNTEITAIIERHKEEIASLRQEQELMWTEKLELLQQEHNASMTEFKGKYQQEQDTHLMEKESVFQAHIEEMNEKTLEKLDVKQSELEALSAELSEVLKARQEIEQKLSASETEVYQIKQEYEAQLDNERKRHREQIGAIEKEKEILTQGVEKDLKEEINNLKLLLDGKEKHLEELQTEDQKWREAAEKAKADLKQVSAQLEEAHHSHEKNTQEKAEAYEGQLTELQEKVKHLTEKRDHLKELGAQTESQLKSVSTELDVCKVQVQNMTLQLEEQNTNMTQKLHSLALESDTQVKVFRAQIEELKNIALERENEIIQLKEAHSQLILELNHNVSAKEKKICSLQEEFEMKNKSQEGKTEKLKQKIKEMQESSKKKYTEMESKLRKELEKKHLELTRKEKQFNEKMLEMAHASSTGISDAMSQLELNHKEQIQNIIETHQRELEEATQTWEKKLNQHIEEHKEKHELELQEKDQEVAELKQQLAKMSSEKEEVDKQIMELREVKSRLDASFHELEEQFGQASAQVLALTQSESHLKAQLKREEEDRTVILNEKKTLEEHLGNLKTRAEEDKSKVRELISKLKVADDKCQELETGRSKEHADFERELQDKLSEKEMHYSLLLGEQEKKLDSCCKEATGLLETITGGLSEKYNDQINRLISRITHCENRAFKLKEAISNQMSRIHALEAQLEKITKEHALLNLSFNQVNQHLQEKENVILSIKGELQALAIEKEVLQKEEGSQQKAADENESCITQLRKELSENINTVTSLTTALKDKDSEVSSLYVLINELKLKLENSVDLSEKEKAIAFLSTQHEDNRQQLLNQIQDLMSKIEAVNQENASSLELADKWKNKLEEWKKKAELKFTQNHNTIKDLQGKVEISSKQSSEKDEKLKKMMEELEHHRSNLDTLVETQNVQAGRDRKEFDLTTQLEGQKTRVLQLEEQLAKLMSENKCLMEELERQDQQKNMEQKQLVQKLQHVQSVASEKDNRSMEAEEKVLRLEKEIETLKNDLGARETAFEQMKTELYQSKDKEHKALEDRLTTESTNKLAELKKKAEQKIASVKKQLLSQLEEKEQSKRDLENKLHGLKEKIQKEGQTVNVGLEQELKEQENKYSLLVEQHKDREADLAKIRDELMSKEQKVRELEDTVEAVQKKLCEREQTAREEDTAIFKEKEAQKLEEIKVLSAKHAMALSVLQEQLDGKDARIKAYTESAEEKTRSFEELQEQFDEIQSREQESKLKLEELENEKQKFRKEVAKLQKDMRMLRKENHQELGLLKKELTEEAEQKMKHEQEDLELKHNSTLKQLMREFNTQMAQKECELETAIQETIGKAQEVEAELLQTHQFEATQLHKKIAEKEDDLKRTVKKYEELLEAREEEMTAKVTELQEQLVKLQEEISRRQEEKEAQEGEAAVSELQTQLAKKTTQLNEAKLMEQEFKEKLHTLEDQMKHYSRNVFATPLGTPYRDMNNRHTDVSVFGEPTEFEYLRKVMFEYMMGRETKTMAKVITTVLRFPAEQAEKILEREDSRPTLFLNMSLRGHT
ncbi:golgin subfamily A member 4 isoform X3 [Ascaphus truei]|uniref:golgin subfamily A member 4 isoform X3 n=1 Tax=Ascaphus truei TaxID=8439 RepID=UPI003F59ED95